VFICLYDAPKVPTTRPESPNVLTPKNCNVVTNLHKSAQRTGKPTILRLLIGEDLQAITG
jgi:hypothetical protein